MNRVSDIRKYFIDELEKKNYVIDKTGVNMLEMIGATFIADEAAIFGTINQDYIQRELDWYKSMSLNVADIPGGPPEIWKQVASTQGWINSNYGYLIWHEENWNQYQNVLEELRRNPFSRRAVMIYTRPMIWADYNIDGMSDFICTNTVQYFIRNDKLQVVVQMRSNDVVFGYKNDYAWQEYVALALCDELGVELGDIIWHVGSLHVYSRHFGLVS
jgi:thymidylate synthase